jgi:hypothetical protein
MTDKDIHVEPGTVVEIDSAVITQIILESCHTSTSNAIRAANRVLEYIAQQHAASGKTTVVNEPPAGLQ